ncbi:MAG: hypothetical protein PHW69_06510 [Elusimicrobiaceae bacterium]|nr:hypothetical protein [Elusimicrobiaceae bacterium]
MKFKTIIFALAVTAAALIYPAVTFGDNITTAPSDKNATNIGSWNDEFWQAYAVYRLVPYSTDGEYYYEYRLLTDLLTVAFTPTTYARGKVALTPDVVVVEWRLSGHIHFVSGL